MNLRDRINQKHTESSEIGTGDERTNSVLPSAKRKKRVPNKVLRIIAAGALAFVSLAVVVIYGSALFAGSGDENEYLFEPSPGKKELVDQFVKAHPYDDFDNDGVLNQAELDQRSNPFSDDTDHDGVADKYDIRPDVADNEVLKVLKASGVKTKDSFDMSGVVLWPSDKSSWVNGGVINTQSGYNFTDFNGWAQFNEKGYAYKVVDGCQQLLKYDDKTNSWKIDGAGFVVLHKEVMPTTNRLSFFKKQSYIHGKFGDFLSAVLPNAGLISCRSMLMEDTYINTNKVVTASPVTLTERKYAERRFRGYTDTLDALADVYNHIDNGQCILASLLSSEGECVVEVFGYQENGSLLVTDPCDTEKSAVIQVTARGIRAVDADEKLTSFTYFDFAGCGFDSEEGDLIAFFEYDPDEVSEKEPESGNATPEPTQTPEPTATPAPTEAVKDFPENGTAVVGGVEYFFIDKQIVMNAFIRKNTETGLWEQCAPIDQGAIYISEEGQKKTGKIEAFGATYIVFKDGNVAFNQFVALNNGEYFSTSPSASGSMYVDSNGQIVTGWFTWSKNKYWANASGLIAHNCFVTKDGNYRYLRQDGTQASNCMVVIDGVEILLDSNGSVINREYAQNIIKRHLEG